MSSRLGVLSVGASAVGVACGCSFCGVFSCCSMRLSCFRLEPYGGVVFDFKSQSENIYRHEIMPAVPESVPYACLQELPLAHRRLLFFLLRLRGDVLALLEPVPQVHPF